MDVIILLCIHLTLSVLDRLTERPMERPRNLWRANSSSRDPIVLKLGIITKKYILPVNY